MDLSFTDSEVKLLQEVASNRGLSIEETIKQCVIEEALRRVERDFAELKRA